MTKVNNIDGLNGMVMFDMDQKEEYQLMRTSIEEIFQELDKLVSNLNSETYQHIKNELYIRAKIKDNPFAAGRPKKYDQKTRDTVLALRKEGKTIRDISKQTNISLGTVSALLRDVQ